MSKSIHISLVLLALSYLFLVYHSASARQEHNNGTPDVSTVHGIEKSEQDGALKQAKLERGKPVNTEITAEELYDAYQSIRNEYNEKAFMCDNENRNSPYRIKLSSSSNTNCGGKWQTLKLTDDGIEISMLHHPSDPTCPYVRMSAIIPGSREDIWNFLALDNWDETMPKLDPFYEGLEITKKYSIKKKGRSKKGKLIEMTLARKRTKRMVTFGKRDFTFVQVSDTPRDDGVWISGSVSVVTDKLPRVNGYTRAFQDSIAFYEEMPITPTKTTPSTYSPYNTDQPQTKITIVCRIDLNDSSENGDGGNIPMWFYVKTIGSAGVMSIKSMQKELERQLIKKYLDPNTTNISDSIEKKDAVFAFVPWFSSLKRGGASKTALETDENQSKDQSQHKEEEKMTKTVTQAFISIFT